MNYRDEGHKHTLVLVHGFAGEAAWRPLVTQLMERPELNSWDIHSFEYPARWLPRLQRFRLVMSPDLESVADLFSTHCRSTLNRYQSIAILAHSGGGLVVLRALLDNKWLWERTTHVALFGTPIGGAKLARILAPVIPQLRDMKPESPFLMSLEEGLASKWQDPPITLRVVAGSDDKEALQDSVFHRFPESIRRTVSGHHISMINPERPNPEVVGVVVNLLSSRQLFLSYVRQDEERVMEVFDVFKRREFTAWIDQRKLKPGDVCENSIKSEIRASDRFLVFLSAAAIAKLSKDSVFKREVDEAIDIQTKRGKGSRFIVPVRIDNQALPSKLARYQWYDLFSGDADGLANLLERSTSNPT
jgi:pimeloyl-ACP methyl ester carboxylesterase